MADAALTWDVTIFDLGKNLEAYGDRVMPAIRALADYFAKAIQDSARQNAPWEDRTGNARTGLFAFTEMAAADAVELYLTHTMDYGKWLELANQGQYAIIMPTLEAFLPQIEAKLRELFE